MQQKHSNLEFVARNVTGTLPLLPALQLQEKPRIFRSCSQHPYQDERFRWYFVEAHTSAGCGVFGPSALATVCEADDCVEILEVFVLDTFRRTGLGRELMLACRENWPEAEWADTPEIPAFSREARRRRHRPSRGRRTLCVRASGR